MKEQESPSELLATFSRTMLTKGDGLVSLLSDAERVALTDELAHSGWCPQSLTVQRSVSRVLSESGRIPGGEEINQTFAEGSLLSTGSVAKERSFAPSRPDASPVPKHMRLLRPSEVWVPTAADREVMAREWQQPKTQESERGKRRAVELVRAGCGERCAHRRIPISHDVRPVPPPPRAPSAPAG